MSRTKKYTNVAGPLPIAQKKSPPKVDEPEESKVDELVVVTPTYNVKTYATLFNEETKRYDMLTIHLNSETGDVKIDRESTKYEEGYRIQQELLKRFANDFIKRK